MEIINSNISGIERDRKQKHFSYTLSKMIEIVNYSIVFYFIVSHVFMLINRFGLLDENSNNDNKIQYEEKSNITIVFSYLFFIVHCSCCQQTLAWGVFNGHCRGHSKVSHLPYATYRRHSNPVGLNAGLVHIKCGHTSPSCTYFICRHAGIFVWHC